MLLPSDVARLVLGYLQEEGLSATSQAFIRESPNLKEYAEHTTGDGTIPACVFSVFGKSLTTILNEYVAVKAKESCHEVPAVMSSLWKKLDFTLNQIKSMQNSPAISACQRTRSRIGVANMARQRVLTVASGGAVVCSSVSATSSVISSAHTSSSILGTSTPVSYTALHTRPVPGSGTHQQLQDGNRLLNTPKDTPVQIIISEHRLNPGPMSPGRRKWDTPRKRSGALSGSTGTGRSTTTVSSPNAEPQPEEVVDENFPQLVIQNARDKILGDRSLQEKLAENINKILANEPTPQTSKSSTVEADQSIDEILGLQGEIHMSDDAIHDILEQTESDPAFQALFDLFDYNKTRYTDGETGDGYVRSSPEESDTAGPSSTVRPLPIDDPGTIPRDANVSDTTQQTMKTRAGQDRKTRKSAASTLLKKTVLGPSGRASRIENSSAKLLVIHEEPRGISSASVNSNRKDNSNRVGVTQMDIGQLHTPSPSMDIIAAQELPTKDSTSTPTAPSEPTTVPFLPSGASAVFTAPAVTSASTVDKKQECKQAEGNKEQAVTTLSSDNQPPLLSPLQVEMNNTTVLTTVLPHMSISSSGGDNQSVSTVSVTLECAPSTSTSSNASVIAVPPSSAYTAAPFTAAPSLPPSVSASATLTPAVASASPASTSCAPVAAAPDFSATNSGAPNKAAADSSNVVSLKIIISDNQNEDSSTDVALNQEISSISGDKIPTIYLSSPAKSFGVPGTPKTTLDEVAQAVSGLQSSEAHASPLSSGKAGALVTSPLTGTSYAQQSYIIQLPLDTTNPALQGATASYFLVTEPPTTDAQSRQVLLPAGVSKGQPLPTNQYGVTTPPCSQGYSTESAVILPSPVKPMMLPVSVMGQNTVGNVQLVPNQLVAIQNPALVPQSETMKPKPTVAISQSTTTGTEQKQVDKVIPPVLSENTGQQDAVNGSSHRRILVFDSSAEVQPQTAKTTRTTTPPPADASTSQPVQPTEKDNTQPYRTKPTILGGNKPKRRIETVRCSADPQAGGGLLKEVEKFFSSQQHQKDPLKKNSRKQDHNISNGAFQSTSASRVDISQTETLKIPESEDMSKSVNRKPTHKRNEEVKVQDSYSSRPLSSDYALKSGSNNDKEESNRKETTEKPLAKSHVGRAEKRTSSQEMPNVTANKENEIKSTLSASASRDSGSPAVTQPSANAQSMATKAPSKTSSLLKQAAEMLQDIQGLNSPSTPVRRPGACSSDCSLPRTAGTCHTQKESADCPRTPSQQKTGKDREGTPKHLMPPNTQDVPNCSPASEAGSENSINMAAHTLMILSRAAAARTGTPLKDSLHQEGVAEKSPASSNNAKKRKQTSPIGSPSAKKESKRPPSKKKDREKKKLMDCFPRDLDVEKFLSSLHYDE